ncbi:alpha/beta hydrolase [Chelatococcus sambhunathii]|uniref:Palmitoyl-protein thioesterase ABHD10, mitochondrial n=1 Tax=Chelatococcus sambhunathii TaxID=363953 RepID=A0ABU1DBY0_9HYPH|nr:alpha/beta hydrolase [Chelatococcus sambhunathii]MDR4305625.1 alpha/beta hydrolase [Chelatococcus sambhunathii]
MTEPVLERFALGEGDAAREIAVLRREGDGPTIVWLGGFLSEMTATKATALDDWAASAGRAMLRFDYSGHGASSGRFEDGTIGQWLEDALAAIERYAGEAPVLVGSSMGGWMALLAARAMATPPAGIVLIAPAPDFTEDLMWARFSEEARRAILDEGVYRKPSQYSAEPTPITRALIEEGRRHLLLGAPIRTRAPVHILQGMDDPDVPWEHAMRLVERLAEDDVVVTLIKDGDHRLSRDEDLARIIEAVDGIAPRR